MCKCRSRMCGNWIDYDRNEMIPMNTRRFCNSEGERYLPVFSLPARFMAIIRTSVSEAGKCCVSGAGGMNELQRILIGDGVGAPPSHVLEAIDEELARRRIAGAPHSIYEEVWHLAFWLELS